MKRLTLSLVILAGLLIGTAPAMAVECVQSDGQPGVYINGQGSDDDRCLTADEYREMVSVDGLLDAGVITGAMDNGDGTATVDHALGGSSTIIVEPLERPVMTNPHLASEVWTVARVLYPAGRLWPT